MNFFHKISSDLRKKTRIYVFSDLMNKRSFFWFVKYRFRSIVIVSCYKNRTPLTENVKYLRISFAAAAVVGKEFIKLVMLLPLMKEPPRLTF